MSFITTGAIFTRAKASSAFSTQHSQQHFSQQPYAFLSARELRGMVAAMVD